MIKNGDEGAGPTWVDYLNLVQEPTGKKKHGDQSQQIDHKHDTNGYEHHTCADFNLAHVVS